MRTKQCVSVGIDGISATVSGCSIQTEIVFPSTENPYLRLKPKGNSTQIAVILPRTIRNNNKIGFRISDCKYLLDVIQKVNRNLKQIIQRDWSELCVTALEVAVTVDLGVPDELTIDSAMNFLSQVLLRQERQNKESKNKNAVRTEPLQKYVTGKKKQGCNFIYDEVTKSLETTLWSNRRLKWKAYSKGAYSEFGGNTSIFRLEGVYCEKGIRQVLNKKDGYVTLKDILTQRAVKGFITRFKTDYTEIIAPQIRGFLNEAEQLVYKTLERASAYNALLINRDIVYDMRIYRRALRKYYRTQNKSDGAYRKMLFSITKRMQREGIEISDKTIGLFETIGKAMNT